MILEEYGKFDWTHAGPGLSFANKFLLRYPSIARVMASGTLMFECILVPCALALDPTYRAVLSVVAMGFHVGIGICQSLVIGIAFSTNIATYVLAFGAPINVYSPEWFASVGIPAILFAYVPITGKLLPEDWPITPVSVFSIVRV